MTNHATSALDRDTEALSTLAPAESTRDPSEVIDARIPVQPAHIEVQEIDVIAVDETERAAEGWIVFIVSLSLLALFVVIFVGYLILDAAALV